MICSPPDNVQTLQRPWPRLQASPRDSDGLLPLSNLTARTSPTCSSQEADLDLAASFLCSSFLAHSQPIIRQILKGERKLPAQMTSCGLCSSLSRCGICLWQCCRWLWVYLAGKLHLSALSSQIPSSAASAYGPGFRFQADFPLCCKAPACSVGNGQGEGKDVCRDHGGPRWSPSPWARDRPRDRPSL